MRLLLRVSRGNTRWVFFIESCTGLYRELEFKWRSQNIVIIHNDLAQKIQTNNLSWNDLPEFVVYSRYVANNCPEVLQYFLNWNNEILFSITDGKSFWIQTQNGNLTMDCGSYPPTTFDLTVTLDTATALLLLTQKLDPQRIFTR